jgi:hypothetical protein
VLLRLQRRLLRHFGHGCEAQVPFLFPSLPRECTRTAPRDRIGRVRRKLEWICLASTTLTQDDPGLIRLNQPFFLLSAIFRCEQKTLTQEIFTGASTEPVQRDACKASPCFELNVHESILWPLNRELGKVIALNRASSADMWLAGESDCPTNPSPMAHQAQRRI